MKRKAGWIPLRVTSIHQDTWDTKTYKFVDHEDACVPFDYRAGQYLTFRFDDIEARPVVRSYSLSSAPSEPELAVTIKRVDKGLVSNYICDRLQVGDVLRARGPIGKFVLKPEENFHEVIFIAAGSGVTPFLGMLKEGVHDKSRSFKLLVSYRTAQDIIAKEICEELKAHANIQIQMTLTRDQHPEAWYGRISEGHVCRLVDGDFSQKTFYLCGPDQMMEDVRWFLGIQGVPKEHILYESFSS